MADSVSSKRSDVKKILVTGGAGFIGSNVVDEYIRCGYEVVVADNLSTGKKANLNPKALFYDVDIRSERLKEIILEESPDVINHHAAQISVPRSVNAPLFDADVNIMGLLNILEAAKDRGVKKIIFASTGGAIYGEALVYPTPEEEPLKPLSPYAISKAASENYLEFYSHRYGMGHTVLRYSNIYGPRQIPQGEAGVVAIFMNNILAGKKSTVYCYPEEPEGMTRDYCYVEDVVRANIIATEKEVSGIFNIGTSIPTTTKALYHLVFNTIRGSGRRLDDSLEEPLGGPARNGDIKGSLLSIAKARRELGWMPTVGLEEGIKRTLEWLFSSKNEG